MQVGGQAVIEGVMMRAPNAYATAVRRANGTIIVKKDEFMPFNEKYTLFKLPFLRGAAGLIEMLYVGIKTLNFSADIAIMDLPEDKKKESRKSNGKPRGQSTAAQVLTLVAAMAIGIALFFILPLYVATAAFDVEQQAFAFNLTAGAIRLTILIGYMLVLSLMKDVRRLFQYHGAEHKSVFAFEMNAELVTENAVKFSRFHPRCGTSFLLIVVFVAILLFTVLDAFLLLWFGKLTLLMRLATHLPLIPLVGGASYEVIKYSAKHSSSWWGRIIVAPGLWMQKITTKEPDEKQIEVALVALRCALGIEDVGKYQLEQVKEEVVK
jgi:uncharacterized protein YqhQ